MLFHLKPSDFIVFRPTFAILHLKTRLSFLQNELFRRTHLYNICMGFRGEFQSFFEKFSERRSHLPQNTQNSQNLLLDILPQIAEANVGGYDILATPTQPLTSRGCSCLSCTNKANGIHVLGWCTSWLVHFLVGALETSAPPWRHPNHLCASEIRGRTSLLALFNNGFIGLNGFVGGGNHRLAVAES